MGNTNLSSARVNPNDEFYTQLEDISMELKHYREHFKDKHVFMNADDPEESHFWKYFKLNFDFLGLKKITSTHFHHSEPTYRLDYDGKEITKTELEQNGDFRSPEAIEILKECDIVVTNPPFSLYREYIAQLIKYNKKFLIIGNYNSITYKEVFPLIKEDKVWVGVSPRSMEFVLPDGSTKSVNASWFTNLEVNRRSQKISLYEKYNKDKFYSYYDYDAINVDRVNQIPLDYYGKIGVPITFLENHNPNQFRVLDVVEPCIEISELMKDPNFKEFKSRQVVKNGVLCQKRYHRLIIQRKSDN